MILKLLSVITKINCSIVFWLEIEYYSTYYLKCNLQTTLVTFRGIYVLFFWFLEAFASTESKNDPVTTSSSVLWHLSTVATTPFENVWILSSTPSTPAAAVSKLPFAPWTHALAFGLISEAFALAIWCCLVRMILPVSISQQIFPIGPVIAAVIIPPILRVPITPMVIFNILLGGGVWALRVIWTDIPCLRPSPFHNSCSCKFFFMLL